MNGALSAASSTTDAAPAFAPIERVGAPSVAEFARQYRRPSRPVILTGALDCWPARGFTLESIERRWADVRIAMLTTRRGVLDIDEHQTGVFRPARLGDHLAAMRDGTCTSYVSVPTTRMPQSFRDELRPLPFCEGAPHLRSRFWLGAAGTVTPLHQDLPDNLSAQLFGRKRWLLWPPGANVYRNPPWSRAPNFARADPERLDRRRFPDFPSSAAAPPLGCELMPGEVLFIPRLWWHHVRSLDDNAALNFWFGGVALRALTVAAELFKRARSLYPGEWD